MLKAVLFDVDFTLFRPGPELGPEGYRRLGERHGLTLDPDRYEDARLAAIETLQHNHELVHDEEIWIAFTEQIVLGMGGDPGPPRVRDRDGPRMGAARELLALRGRAAGARRAAASRAQDRADLERPARPRGVREHHALDVDAVVGSKAHGRVKPHASIFVAALRALDARPEETAMVGDSYEDDIEGARALGIRAILLDRDGCSRTRRIASTRCSRCRRR